MLSIYDHCRTPTSLVGLKSHNSMLLSTATDNTKTNEIFLDYR